LAQAEGYGYFDAALVRTVGVECVEIELMHSALPSTSIGVHRRGLMNQVRAGDSRPARGQIDLTRAMTMRDERVAL
jgi:hypothetical protein